MLALIIAPFFLALQLFVYSRAKRYLYSSTTPYKSAILTVFGILFFGGFVAIVLGFILPVRFAAKRLFTVIGNYWLGFLLYFFLALFVSVIVRSFLYLFLKDTHYNKLLARTLTAFVAINFTVIMSFIGIRNAHDLKITEYEVTINKKAEVDELNVVLLADLHIGYNTGIKEMRNVVRKVNALDADVVLVAGDIFDNDFDAVEDPEVMEIVLGQMKSKYGTYVCFGNHDIQEKILVGFTFTWSKEKKAKVQADDRMLTLLERAGWNILYDDYIEIEGINIYGRPDYEKVNFGNTSRLSAEEIAMKMDLSKPTIIMDHEPREQEELDQIGADLLVSGHTHDGQLWPGTLTIHLLWDNAYGYKLYGDLHNIVTSGAGLFGPNMRVDSLAEIAQIHIHFQ